MKIFIDARMTKIGGTYTYTNSLLEAILQQDADSNEYFVLYADGQRQILPNKSKNLIAPFVNPIYWLYWDKIRLPKIVSANEIDIYHSFKRPDITRIKEKKIITLHSAYPFLYPELQGIGEKLYWNKMMRKAAQCADAVLAVSETDKKKYIESINLDSQKIFVHQLGLSDSFSRVDDKERIKQIRRKYNLPEKYLLFVGSFYLFKNIPSIIKAFSLAKNTFKIPHKLVLVGQGGSGSRDVFKTIQEMQMKDEIVLTGPITEDLSEIYSGADAFLFPTLYDSFGFPVLEAMAHGVPVIISTAGALPEVAGEAALKFDPFNVNDISKGIYSLITDTALRDKMIKRGYKRIQKFSWERCAKETISVYKKVFDK